MPAKPPKKAFAIRPSSKKGEPTIHAAGEGSMAEQIIALARKNGIPVTEDPKMAEALSQLNIEQEIPPELYPVVGEILNFANRVNDAMIEEDERRLPTPGDEGELPPRRY